jgi:hypothetical protein
MASNQINQTGSFYLTGSFTASLGFDGTASFAKRADAVDSTLSNGLGIETFTFNGSSPNDVQLDTSSAHFNTPINAATGSLVNSGSISGNTLTLHLGDGSALANILVSASYAVTASHALNSAGGTTDIFDNIDVTVLNYAGQDKFTINGLEAPTVTLGRAGTYRFDQSDGTNAGQTLSFETIAGVAYTTGVTTVGTAGTAGAYTQIVVGMDTPVNLRYRATGGTVYGNYVGISDMHSLSATGSLQGTLDGTATSASLATQNIVTASAVINRITFTKGDGSTFDVFVAQSGSIATASFAESVEYDGILNKPTLVSGSSQISYTGITDIPYLVSESAQITLESTTFTDGDAFSLLRTDGAGNIAFDFADRAYFNVRAAETLAKGDPMYVSGYNIAQDRVLVSKADANDPAKMPVVGLAAEAITAASNGVGVLVGVLDTIDTSTFTVGDELYVANGGGLTATEPTGNDEVQTVGIVIRSDATNGRIAVAARMSSNAAASATVDTGSLLTTSSITNLTQSFTKGDGSTYTNLIELSGSTITGVTLNDSIITGSFSGSFTGTVSGSLTNAVSASHAVFADTASQVGGVNSGINIRTGFSGQLSASLGGEIEFDGQNGLYTQVDFIDTNTINIGVLSNAEFDIQSVKVSEDVTITPSNFYARTPETGALATTGSPAALFMYDGDTWIEFATTASLNAATSSLSSSASTARDTAASQVSGAFAADSASFSTRITAQEDFSSSLDATFVTEAELVAATASLSASLTTTDQTISSSVATLSGSASTARDAIVASISGAFQIPDGTVSSSAQTIANLPAGTVSGSAQVTGSTIITGSVNDNTLTFTKGDGTTFDLVVITSSGGGSTDTGSLLTTASISDVTMSFTKGDASTFDLIITRSISASYAETASLLLGSVESASFASTASFVTASHVHGPHGTSSVATASRAVTSSKVDPYSALTDLQNYADDEAALIGGVPLGGLYRNGNFVLIRVTTPYVDDYYLTGFSNTNFVSMGATLNNFLVQNQPWSFGYRLAATIVTNGDEITTFSTDNGAFAIELDSASSWYTYLYSNTNGGSFNSVDSEPTQTNPSYWLHSYNGTTLTTYYNGTQIDTSTADTALPTSTSGNVAFGKSIQATREAWQSAVGVSAMYFANEALASSINSTAAANNGDITSDAEYSKVDGFINVLNGSLVDLKQNFTPTVQGSLTFTAK